MVEGEYFPKPREVVRAPEKKEASIKEAAKKSRISFSRLRYLCREGLIPAKKVFPEKGGRGNPRQKKWVILDLDKVFLYKKKRPKFDAIGALGGRGKKAKKPGSLARRLLLQAMRG
jgi:hypothetical protein